MNVWFLIKHKWNSQTSINISVWFLVNHSIYVWISKWLAGWEDKVLRSTPTSRQTARRRFGCTAVKAHQTAALFTPYWVLSAKCNHRDDNLPLRSGGTRFLILMRSCLRRAYFGCLTFGFFREILVLIEHELNNGPSQNKRKLLNLFTCRVLLPRDE